jgi:hypothetical protein
MYEFVNFTACVISTITAYAIWPVLSPDLRFIFAFFSWAFLPICFLSACILETYVEFDLDLSQPVGYTDISTQQFMFLLFMSMGRDYISELQPLTGLLFIPQIYEYGEPRWNDINRVKPKTLDKNLSQCHFVHYKSHMD